MRPITIPEPFWLSLPEHYQDELSAIDDEGMMLFPTGSRLFCPCHATEDSDWDVFARITLADAFVLIDQGWDETSRPRNPNYPPSSISMRFRTTRNNRSLNLIGFYADRAFNNFAAATEFCHSIGGPTDRDKRVKVFKAFAT